MLKTEYFRRSQPHFQHIGHVFSVTILAKDAIPQIARSRLIAERQVALAKIPRDPNSENGILRAKIHSAYELKLEELLNATAQQSHPFRDEEIAQIILQVLREYDSNYYELEAACIMSNHLHLLLNFYCQVPAGWAGEDIPRYTNLGKVIGYIKGRVSYLVNKSKGKKIGLWSNGYYDRYIRSDKHFSQVFYYIVNNPVKAGLVPTWDQYQYTYASTENVELFLA